MPLSNRLQIFPNSESAQNPMKKYLQQLVQEKIILINNLLLYTDSNIKYSVKNKYHEDQNKMYIYTGYRYAYMFSL